MACRAGRNLQLSTSSTPCSLSRISGCRDRGLYPLARPRAERHPLPLLPAPIPVWSDDGARAVGATDGETDADVGFTGSARRRWCRRRASAASYGVIDNRSESALTLIARHSSRSITTTSTAAFARVLAAHNPPNPAPTITTRGGVVSERAIDGMAPDMTGHYIDIASVIFN